MYKGVQCTATVLCSQPRQAASTYLFEYISLMFILLAFVIGAFRLEQVENAHSPHQNIASAAPNPIGSLELPNLFDAKTTTLNQDRSLPLVQFLQNHDIRADIDIPSGEAGEAGLDQALSRGVQLSRYLLGQGLPFSAFRVTITPSRASYQAVVRFFREDDSLVGGGKKDEDLHPA